MSFRATRLLFSLVLLLPVLAGAASVPKPPQVKASAYVLVDAASGQTVVEHNADQPMPPASLTKMMTVYVTAEELKSGDVSLDDPVPISVNAWEMGGSRMFVREGTRVELRKLLRGIMIQSGNDASVAVAEHVAGSEDAFADLMNHQADELGMNNTHFVNATGWPTEDHYASARDLAILARAIIRNHPETYELYSQKSYTYNGIKQNNRNMLLWRDPSVDGLKTGHTEEAGYCLVSSAERDGQRWIAVVMGTESEEARARESMKLLTYGFRFFETYEAYKAGEELTRERIWMGTADELPLGSPDDLVVTIPEDSHDQLKAEMTVDQDIRAPVKKGERYGTVTVRLDGETLLEKPLVALENIERAGLFSRLWDHIVRFVQSLFA
jgi:D-alanyl-D-alanine carboxypeptidase (penicillin-binding protein 5/6)